MKSQIINTGTATFTQNYQYDSLNRLTEAKEVSNGNQTWKQNFGYDRFGNRTNINEYTGTSLTNSQTPQVDAINNRFTTASGFVYDLNGNVVTDNQSGKFEYDAENRQKEVRDSNNILTAKYVCDGNGNRVKKVVIASGETTIFVYDANSKLIAEYSTQISQNPQVQYLTNDTLGSPRILTDGFGKIISRRDFRPFGEEVFADGNVRTINQKYGINDEIDQKFSGKERDTETGLDYFLARYYANQHGRFTSTDPIIMAKLRLIDPQQINLYGYARNNPLKYIDPTGEIIKVTGSVEDQKKYVDDVNKKLTGVKVKINKDGLLVVDGKSAKKLSGAASDIVKGINSSKTANISLVRNDGQVDFGSAFSLNQKGDLDSSTQRIDYGDLEVLNKAGIEDFNSSSVAVHETIEAIGIQINGKSKDDAHDIANKSAPGLEEVGARTATTQGNSILGFTYNYQVQGGGSRFTVDAEFAKPFTPAPGQKPPRNEKETQEFRAKNPINIKSVVK